MRQGQQASRALTRLLALLSFCVATSDVSSQTRADPAPSRWSVPINLFERMPHLGIVETPSVSMHAGELLFAAAAIDLRKPPDAAAPRVLVVARGRLGTSLQPLRLPEFSGRIVAPRAGVDPSGLLHLLWGSADTSLSGSPVAPGRSTPPATTLWHSVMRGNEWSRPRRLFTALRIDWDMNGSTDFGSHDGALHVAFPASIAGVGRRIVYVRTGGDTAAVNIVPHRLNSAYLSLTNSGSYVNLVAIGVSALDTVAGAENRNRVFALRSPDRGVTWDSVRFVTGAGEDPAYHVRTTRAAGGVLHAMWLSSQLSGAPLTLTHKVSLDNGITFRDVRRHLLREMSVSNPWMAADNCGRVYYAFAPQMPSPSHALLLSDSGFTDVRTPFTVVASSPVVLLANDIALHAIWTQANDTRGASMVMYSALHHLSGQCR